MPKVGKKEFPYTAKGMAMAKAEAKKSGKNVATKKSAAAKKPDPKNKKYSSSAADFRKADQESMRIYRETKRNPKDANGNSYFGAGGQKTPMGQSPKVPGRSMPPGTPWKERSPSGKRPSSSPKRPPVGPRVPKPKTTTTTTVPRGLAQSSVKKTKNVAGGLASSSTKKKIK